MSFTPKRFYSRVDCAEADGGFTILLDGRPTRTPGKRPLVVPTRRLADGIVAEWAAQSGEIKPDTMPLMRLAATAIDRVTDHRAAVIDEIAGYAATDLLCYRATEPAALVDRQAAAWQPLLDWLLRRYDVALAVTSGIIAVAQPAAGLARLKTVVAARDDFALAALHALTSVCGSLVLALAVAEGEIDAARAFDLAHLDELHQAEFWGEDAEAAARRAALRQDLQDTVRFLDGIGQEN